MEPFMPKELILVIDDDPATLRIIQKILASKGYEVHTATDDREGMAHLAAHSYALVILDVHLPYWNATQVVQHLQNTPHRPLLVVMSSDYESRLWAEEVGAIGFLEKPIDFGSLLQTVRQLYQAHQSQSVRPTSL
jgi:DNA-binding response OmpR family regulator